MATTRATTRTITNAWVDRTLPDIFYEEPEPPEDAWYKNARYIVITCSGSFTKTGDVFISGACRL